MNIKINNFFNNIFDRNKKILEQINLDENIEKCCKNCKYKRYEEIVSGYPLREKCSKLKVNVENQWICKYHEFSNDFIKEYIKNIKIKEAELRKRQGNKRPKVYNK